MKSTIRLLLFTLFVFCKNAHCQEPAEGIFPLKDGKIYYEKVIVVDSATKDEIFKRVKFWAVDALSSQKRGLETEDKEAGYIIYKMSFSVPFTSPPMTFIKEIKTNWNFSCTLKFEIKDFKTKVSIINLEASQSIRILNFKEDFESAMPTSGPTLSKKYKAKYYDETRKTFIRQIKKLTIQLMKLINHYE